MDSWTNTYQLHIMMMLREQLFCHYTANFSHSGNDPYDDLEIEKYVNILFIIFKEYRPWRGLTE